MTVDHDSPIEARILEVFQAPKAQPMTKSELARVLHVPPKERAELREAVRALEASGKIEKLKKGRYSLPVVKQSSHRTISGTVRFIAPDKSRNAYIELDEASQKMLRDDDRDRLFIAAKFSGVALPGDRVTATLHKAVAQKWQKHVKKLNRPGETRWEARVAKVESRKRSRYVGTLVKNRGFAHVIPDEAAFGRNIDVDPQNLPPGAKDDYKVLFRIDEWDSQFQNPKGTVVKALGRADDAGVDILSIIHSYGLPLEFPDAVEAEAQAISKTIDEAEIDRREDWRDRDVFTIDPFDAKDFDDAICVTRLEDGGWELGVFIADVAHYVRPGSQLDIEAKKRGNSVYLVDRVVPMLPEALSNGICSLRPDEDRLTHAAILDFDAKGHRRKKRFTKAVICSKRRFSYEQAFELMGEEGAKPKDEAEWIERLQRCWELAAMLRKLRMDHGSLDLDFPDVKVILNDDGKPIELRQVHYDISHQLIEEFMLAANEAVAEFTKNQQGGGIYRIHEDPDLNKLYEFRDLARAYGHQVGDLSLRSETQKLLRAIRGTPEEHPLKIGFLKSLKRAVYSEMPLGHYGLAKLNYTHFTSPIRRYADLVVHRVLEKLATRRDESPRLPRKAELAEIAQHLSETERTAADAENESKLLKQFEYFLNIARGEDRVVFNAVITEVLPRGVFVELTDYFIRGMIRREDIPRRDFYLMPQLQKITDGNGETIAHAGSKIRVQIRRVNIERKHLDLVFADEPTARSKR